MKINYRTTEEIRKHAFALLNGISFDDLDEDLDLGDKCQSLTHGEKPIVENFENANDEFDFLLREVKKLKENGVSLTDICYNARRQKRIKVFITKKSKALEVAASRAFFIFHFLLQWTKNQQVRAALFVV